MLCVQKLLYVGVSRGEVKLTFGEGCLSLVQAAGGSRSAINAGRVLLPGSSARVVVDREI